MKEQPLETDQTENDEDILGMVREINMGHLESNDGDDSKEIYGGRKTGAKKRSKKVSASLKRNKIKNSKVPLLPVSKNNRHLTDESGITSKSSPARYEKALKEYSCKSDVADLSESENLASCVPQTKTSSSKRKKKGSRKNLDCTMDVDVETANADTLVCNLC